MKQYVKKTIEAFPVVRLADVNECDGGISVDITIRRFDWDELEQVFEKKLDLLDQFNGKTIDFRLVGEPSESLDEFFAA